jgi:hypothetical protein
MSKDDALRNAVKKPNRQPSPDDGPEDMELTLRKNPVDALNSADNAFDALAKKRFGGINTKPSVFEKGALFRTDR